MKRKTSKVKCLDCKWHGEEGEIDQIRDPKSSMIWNVCQKDGCKKEVTCGTPTEDGYKSTCAKHIPESTKPVLLPSGSEIPEGKRICNRCGGYGVIPMSVSGSDFAEDCWLCYTNGYV